MSARVVILGIFVADTTFRANRQPRMGETILGNSFQLGPGGKGSNQAVAAARSGAETYFISRLGSDAFADMADAIWRDAGVHAAVSRHQMLSTGAAHIFIEEASGDNAIIVCPGVAETISAADLESHAELIASAGVFMTQLEQPLEAARHGLQLARDSGVKTILNPAPAAVLDDAMLGLCDFITPNETEAEALTGIGVATLQQAEAAAIALRQRGAAAAIITLGERGALYHDAETTLHVEAFDAGPVVETTGAGDAFNGGLATALAQGKTAAEAVRFGCATAALSVTRAGTAGAMPALAEITALLNA